MQDIFNTPLNYDVFSREEEEPACRRVCRKPGLAGEDPRMAMLEPLWSDLRVPEIPDPRQVAQELRTVAPGMALFADWLAGELTVARLGSDPVCSLPPILLYGPPGVGKTHLARAIAKTLELPCRLVNLASSSDSRTLMGTSAGYATGAACLPAQTMAATRCLSPVIVLDEIDKCAGDSRNGSWTDGLLPFLEPVSARAILDEFMMVEVDTSKVTWIATANRIERIPAPLVSRFACFEMTGTSAGASVDPLALALRALASDLDMQEAALRDLLAPAIRDGLPLPRQASVRDAKGMLRAVLGDQLLAQRMH